MATFTTDCRNILINDLQCKFADHISSLSKALQYRKKNLTCLKRDAIIARKFITLLYNYVTFEEEVTAAFSITITKEDGTDITTLEIDGVTVASYSGSGTAQDIVQEFYNDITNGATVWEAEFSGNTLYIYSYDNSVNYNTTIETTSSFNFTTSEISSLEDNLDAILDIWNCLEYEDMCAIYEHGKKILNTNDCNC